MVSIMREHFHTAYVGPVYLPVLRVILIHSHDLRQRRTREKYSPNPVLDHTVRY